MSITLHARRLNHGQSAVWLTDEKEQRIVATNYVISTVHRHCSKEEFEAFDSALHESVGGIAGVVATGTMAHDLGLENA